MFIAQTEIEPKLLPGDLALWFFIFMELLVFGIFFIAYAVMRLRNIEMFNQYQLTLNRELGAGSSQYIVADHLQLFCRPCSSCDQDQQ